MSLVMMVLVAMATAISAADVIVCTFPSSLTFGPANPLSLASCGRRMPWRSVGAAGSAIGGAGPRSAGAATWGALPRSA